MRPIASYRNEQGRLCLLADCGPDAGVYAGRPDGRTIVGATWIAMRADVALKMLELGRCGFGSKAASTLREFVLSMDHPRATERNWPVWGRLPVGVSADGVAS